MILATLFVSVLSDFIICLHWPQFLVLRATWETTAFDSDEWTLISTLYFLP